MGIKKDRVTAVRGKATSLNVRSPNTCAHVQILGAGGDIGGVPSAMLFFDHTRFVFNLPEGFQRYAAENKFKLNKISAAMFTRSSMEAAGGLPGMVLSVQDQEETMELAMYGHKRLHSLVDAMHTFISSSHLDRIGKHFFGDTPLEPVFEDSVVSIRSVVITAAPNPESVKQSPSAAANENAEREVKRQRASYHGRDNSNLDPVVCYVAKLADTPGKFMPEKAAALNVPKGPKFAQLVRGESVEASDGTIVRPDQVLGPGVPGSTVIVVDCPTIGYLPSLLTKLASFVIDSSSESREHSGTVCLVHLSPQQVVSDAQYVSWMKTFGDKATHIMASECNGETVLFSAARLQRSLHAVDQDVFPLHSTRTSNTFPMSSQVPNCVPGRNRLKFHLRPVSRIGVDESEVPIPTEDKAVTDEAFTQLLLKAQATQIGSHIPATIANISRSECEITLLGTGSSIPSKYRNVTGIYVNLFDAGGMMLDCGEDSYGQMVRRFGVEGAQRAIAGLKLIWVSHIHADHHVGLARLLAVRQVRSTPFALPHALIKFRFDLYHNFTTI